MWSPGPRGRILTEYTVHFSADPELPYSVRTIQRLLLEFWILVDWLPFLPDLNPLDFAIWAILPAKVQAMPHANLDALRPSIVVEWDCLVVK
jgi:hypothetical protein